MDTPCILLLIDNQGNRLILADYLAPFELISLSPQSINPSRVTEALDLVILDLEILIRHRTELAAWRERLAPLLLPTLVLMQPDDVSSLTPELLQQIDAFIIEPVDTNELSINIATLLRTRHLSCQLEQKVQELAEARKLKARFIAAIAHEFRNPLSLISGITQLLQRGGQKLSPEKQQDMLGRIRRAVERITKMIDELLAFNRNASDQMTFNPQPLDLEAHCWAILNDFKLLNAATNEIIFITEGDLAALSVDAELVTTILVNLLSNALKYSPEGSLVCLQLRRQEQQVIIEVIDSGRGIPEADLPVLFDAFFRARNVGETKGTGLGLSISYKIITEKHQGMLQCHS
ncbi:MAG: ATP-binding protein, partial [Cyanobacteria bacterium J06636_16]